MPRGQFFPTMLLIIHTTHRPATAFHRHPALREWLRYILTTGG